MATRVVAGEEPEDDEVDEAAAATAAPVDVPAGRVVQGEESEEDETTPTATESKVSNEPTGSQAPPEAVTIAKLIPVQTNSVRSSTRQRKLVELSVTLERDLDVVLTMPLKSLRKSLAQLSIAVTKNEKVVQEVSSQMLAFNEDLNGLDAALSKVPFSLWTSTLQPTPELSPQAAASS